MLAPHRLLQTLQDHSPPLSGTANSWEEGLFVCRAIRMVLTNAVAPPPTAILSRGENKYSLPGSTEPPGEVSTGGLTPSRDRDVGIPQPPQSGGKLRTLLTPFRPR